MKYYFCILNVRVVLFICIFTVLYLVSSLVFTALICLQFFSFFIHISHYKRSRSCLVEGSIQILLVSKLIRRWRCFNRKLRLLFSPAFVIAKH